MCLSMESLSVPRLRFCFIHARKPVTWSSYSSTVLGLMRLTRSCLSGRICRITVAYLRSDWFPAKDFPRFLWVAPKRDGVKEPFNSPGLGEEVKLILLVRTPRAESGFGRFTLFSFPVFSTPERSSPRDLDTLFILWTKLCKLLNQTSIF